MNIVIVASLIELFSLKSLLSDLKLTELQLFSSPPSLKLKSTSRLFQHCTATYKYNH